MNELKIKILIVVTLFFLILLGVDVFFGDSFRSLFSKKTKVSPDVLMVTKPIHSLIGKVVKIEKDKLTISHESTNTVNAPLTNFTVKVPKNFLVSVTFHPIPYHFSQTDPIQQIPFIKYQDLELGEIVVIQTNDDLRITTGKIPLASQISIVSSSNFILGEILSITDHVLSVKGRAQLMPTDISTTVEQEFTREKLYSVQVDQNTEISYVPSEPSSTLLSSEPPAPPPPKQASFADLKPGMTLYIYTNKNVLKSPSVLALRIEPFGLPATTSVEDTENK
ncbi:hypothetical protein A2334_01640 [Candidatus Roizmanbacteria bacterium RIFOXYB2_FULL_38_10]|uniref:Uncharacterized protein n=1 Tax=Candidatus Roizmanbacteria bacterium RIFOXYD1_FULL_38_12 TaxID=1802093 RepID=A0A1F7L1P9_9BACT|nr:MAG: hypothetical protein A3K47_04700 [Candidatus Roizmanbacteria bacterium RIFOXYA2_FULL_38_14]OGK64050.1 MAG: hypothetical protein A3K27_04700 [Candidatus Roizmanbacteria bacterium RIFOXYA1_FULL_37_12]OGK65896.1 MAG: hypothetical protein A3K38_04700 [Candidatus Roizmanbacteria bacterium RIFOXYB1_FULL_40_23]OGK68049.1 MAG: hypothetical protein A2334_01640 [Candidatus Roizmanbacteria bacterium RIFOXYB2_FULL_38_10]OGK70301.1 MAG: hypothetical protein A3K21_04705 [Candidatus Roizmanbacteria ba